MSCCDVISCHVFFRHAILGVIMSRNIKKMSINILTCHVSSCHDIRSGKWWVNTLLHFMWIHSPLSTFNQWRTQPVWGTGAKKIKGAPAACSSATVHRRVSSNRHRVFSIVRTFISATGKLQGTSSHFLHWKGTLEGPFSCTLAHRWGHFVIFYLPRGHFCCACKTNDILISLSSTLSPI